MDVTNNSMLFDIVDQEQELHDAQMLKCSCGPNCCYITKAAARMRVLFCYVCWLAISTTQTQTIIITSGFTTQLQQLQQRNNPRFYLQYGSIGTTNTNTNINYCRSHSNQICVSMSFTDNGEAEPNAGGLIQMPFNATAIGMDEGSTFQAPSSRERRLASVLDTLMAEDLDNEIQQREPEDSVPSSKSHQEARTKWKKKRYVMLQDVATAIQRGDPNAPQLAEDTVQRMRKLYEASGKLDLVDEYKPTIQAFNLWIHSLAKLPEQGPQAEAIMQQMLDLGIEPNIVTYTSVIDAYSRTKKGAQQAERVLFAGLEKQVVEGNLHVSSVTCDAVLNAWAQQGTLDAAERAYLILQRMEYLQNKDIKPSTHSYATVMNGFAKCGDAERVEAIILNLLKQAGQKDAIKVDTVVFNVAINAWQNSKDPRAGSKAQALLNQMEELSATFATKPDTVSYNSAISAWAGSGHVNAASQAEKILQKMQKEALESGDAPRPNTVSYNAVLHAHSRSGQPGSATRAQTILEYMIRSRNPDIEPDVYSFTSVLNALAKSKDPQKATKCQQLLDVLLDLYQKTNRATLRPSEISFNTVLNAAAFSSSGTTQEQQRTALQVAVGTFTKLRNFDPTGKIKPDTISYGNLIKCCANLMPQGNARSDMAVKVFEQCCRDGMVGELVWNEIRRAVTPTSLLPVIPKALLERKGNLGSVDVSDLPRNWRHGVESKKNLGAQRKKDEKAAARVAAKKTPPPARPVPGLRSITESSYQSGKDL